MAAPNPPTGVGWFPAPPEVLFRGLLIETPEAFRSSFPTDVVHLPLESGLTVLAGVNGSGKTYLLEAIRRILAGNMRPTEGALVDVPSDLKEWAAAPRQASKSRIGLFRPLDRWEWPNACTDPQGRLRKQSNSGFSHGGPYDEDSSPDFPDPRVDEDLASAVTLEGREAEILREVLDHGSLLITSAYPAADRGSTTGARELVGVPVLPPGARAPITRATIGALASDPFSVWDSGGHILVNARNGWLDTGGTWSGLPDNLWVFLPPVMTFDPLSEGHRLADFLWGGTVRVPGQSEWAFHLALALDPGFREGSDRDVIRRAEDHATTTLRAAVGSSAALRFAPETFCEAVSTGFRWYPTFQDHPGWDELAHDYMPPGRREEDTQRGTQGTYGLYKRFGVGVLRDHSEVPAAEPGTDMREREWKPRASSLDSLSRVERQWAELSIEAACRAMTTHPIFVLIDEPDAGLHRQAEHRAAQHLAGPDPLGLGPLAVVISTTHSPDFINQPNAHVYRVEEGHLQPFTRSNGELAKAFGLRPADILASQKALLLVEGIHDQIVIEDWYGKPTRAKSDQLSLRGIAVAPLYGVKNANNKTVFDMWLEYSTAPICVLMDNTDNTQLHSIWQQALTQADEDPAAAGLTLGDLLRMGTGEARSWHQILDTALRRGAHRRIHPFGLSKGDVIEYLPPEPFGLHHWDRDGYEEYRRRERRPVDFKSWHRQRHQADIRQSTVSAAAAAVGDGDEAQTELDSIMSAVFTVATRQ